MKLHVILAIVVVLARFSLHFYGSSSLFDLIQVPIQVVPQNEATQVSLRPRLRRQAASRCFISLDVVLYTLPLSLLLRFASVAT